MDSDSAMPPLSKASDKDNQSRRISRILSATGVLPLLISLAYTVLGEPDPTRNLISVATMAVFIALFLIFTLREALAHVTLILALQMLVATVMSFVPGVKDAFYIFVVYAVLCAEIGMALPLRTATKWFGCILAVTVAAYVIAFGPISGALIALGNAAGFFFFIYVGNLIHESEINGQRSEKMAADLRAANEQLQALNLQTQHLAIVDERNRMARELHDSLGHRLTVAAVQIEGAQRILASDPERAERMLRTVREEIKSGLTDLRLSVAALRAPLDEALPIVEALRRLASAFEASTGITVALEVPDTVPALSQNQRLALWHGILIKENHIAAAGGIPQVLENARALNAGVEIQIEVERMDQLQQALDAGATSVLLDNFTLEAMREAVALTAGRALLEASGGISLDALRNIAATGVDRISIGKLTKDVVATDYSLRILSS